ncbi:MAG: YmdB family metallophosphoesterase [Ruminococcaceae bacterium]|nr:YmdB family metallophosphoesterase [Oscillospiraceae bacterium]
MVVLAIGDIVGDNGVNFLMDKLPSVKKFYGADMTIVNAENSAPSGRGVTSASISKVFSAGADIITTGNHAFDSSGYEKIFDETSCLLRPANLAKGIPGRGYDFIDLAGMRVLVLNLLGMHLMGTWSSNIYEYTDSVLSKYPDIPIIVDLHAESTAEKIAYAKHYDGKLSFVFGTHTHVLTADERILPLGTAFITDIGMTGPIDSVIGVNAELAAKKQRYGIPIRFFVEDGPSALTGAVVEIDRHSKSAINIERIRVV